MWSSSVQLTLARRAALPLYTTRSRLLALCQHHRVQQTRTFSQTPKPQSFIDPRKIISYGERLGNKPLENYPPIVRKTLFGIIDSTQQLKKLIEDLERDEQAKGVSKDDSEASTAQAFTTAVILLLLAHVIVIEGLITLLWGGKSKSEKAYGSLPTPKLEQGG